MGHENGGRRGFHQPLEFFRPLPQVLVRLSEVLDIQTDAEPAHHPAGRVPDRTTSHLEPTVSSVVSPDAILNIVVSAGMHCFLPRRFGPESIVRMEQAAPAIR